jgi:hypothetical protein
MLAACCKHFDYIRLPPPGIHSKLGEEVDARVTVCLCLLKPVADNDHVPSGMLFEKLQFGQPKQFLLCS